MFQKINNYAFLFRVGHDNAGIGSDWYLERVEIDAPKMGQSWIFPCGKWLSKSKGDCQLEVELYPKATASEVYIPSKNRQK